MFIYGFGDTVLRNCALKYYVILILEREYNSLCSRVAKNYKYVFFKIVFSKNSTDFDETFHRSQEFNSYIRTYHDSFHLI